jgi:DNA-binding beta-propeller fold protein YncE
LDADTSISTERSDIHTTIQPVWAGLVAVLLTAIAVMLPSSALASPQSGALSQLSAEANCVGETEEASGAHCGTTIGSGLHLAYQAVVSPDGRNAYSVAIDGALVEYSRNQANGALSVIGCITSTTLLAPCAPENESDGETVVDSLAAIAISPDGRYVYVLDQDKNMVVELSRDPETGLLSVVQGPHHPECISEGSAGLCETSTAIGLNTPYGIAMSPNGENVYVASLGSEAVAEFSRNTETGALQEIPGDECIGSASSGCPVDTAIGLKEAIGIVVSPPNGEDVYVAAGAKSGTEGDVAAFRRNEGTGVLEQLEHEEACVGDGVLGCAKGIAFAGSEDLAISPDGKNVYANSYNESAVVELSRETSGPTQGALSQLGGENACVTSKTISGCTTVPNDRLGGLAGVAISPDGANVYAGSFGESSVGVFKREALAGELKPLQAPYECVTTEATGCGEAHGLVGLQGARRLTVSPDGTNVYVAGQSGNDIVELARAIAPTVTGLSPNDGPSAGHAQVMIEGSGFADGVRVEFGETPALSVTVNSASSITATSPAGSGSVDVTVANAVGTSAITQADVYVYGRLGGLQLSGYCETLGDDGKDAKGEGPTALVKETVEGPEYAYNNWACVEASGAVVPIAAAGPAPSMNNACAVQYPAAGPSHAAAENPNNAFSWNCFEGAPAASEEGARAEPEVVVQQSGAKAKVASTGPPEVPRPSLAVTGNVAPISGTVLVRVPGSSTFVSLSSLRQIPFGTVIEATHGHVGVTTAQPNGTTQTGEFFEGEFVLKQGRNGLVIAELTGGNFSVCPTARERAHKASASAAASHASGKHVVRKLWANAHGSFSTKGNYAAGAVQGTEWLTEDLCEGTIIRVTRDKVAVTNLVNHHHVEVTTGHKYLAKAP